jgi:hypothetical protein
LGLLSVVDVCQTVNRRLLDFHLILLRLVPCSKLLLSELNRDSLRWNVCKRQRIHQFDCHFNRLITQAISLAEAYVRQKSDQDLFGHNATEIVWPFD